MRPQHNPYCTKRGIVLEDLGNIQYTVKQGNFMIVDDLDSGYWHVLSNKFLYFSDGHMFGSAF